MVHRLSAMTPPPGFFLREAPNIAVKLFETDSVPPLLPPSEGLGSGEDEQKPLVREPEEFWLRLIKLPVGANTHTHRDPM